MTSEPSIKLKAIFEFLRKNHGINKDIQEGFLRETLSSYETNEERARLLLHKMVNSQSQPKLDPICEFFQLVASDKKSISSFKKFVRFLTVNSEANGGLFDNLKAQPGWGPKTAALFVRNLAMIEQNQVLRSLFWDDLDVIESEEIYLPVDAVIKSIFSRLKADDFGLGKSVPKTFDSINDFLKNHLKYSNKDMLIWDDLWFWGFVTQKSNVNMLERTHEWNNAKYWSIFNASKDQRNIEKIKGLAAEFLGKF